MTSLRKLAVHFGHFFGGSAMMLVSFVTFPILTAYSRAKTTASLVWS